MRWATSAVATMARSATAPVTGRVRTWLVGTLLVAATSGAGQGEMAGSGHWAGGHLGVGVGHLGGGGHFGETTAPSGGPPPPVGGGGATINGVSLASLGATMTNDIDGWLSPPDHSWSALVTPGDPGYTTDDMQEESRPIVLAMDLVGTDALDARSKRDHLVNVLTRLKPLEIVLDDLPTRKLFAFRRRTIVTPYGAGLIADQFHIRVDLDAADPMWLDLAESSALNFTAATALPQGTGPVRPRTRIKGPATDPILRLRAQPGGAIVGEMGFLGTLASGEFWAIDHDERTIYRNTSGAFDSGVLDFASWINAVSPGDFFPILPEHGDFHTSTWPTLEVSSGTVDAFWFRSYR